MAADDRLVTLAFVFSISPIPFNTAADCLVKFVFAVIEIPTAVKPIAVNGVVDAVSAGNPVDIDLFAQSALERPGVEITRLKLSETLHPAVVLPVSPGRGFPLSLT